MATIIDLLQALNRGDLPPLPLPAQPMSLGPLQPPNVPQYGGPSQVIEPPQAPLDMSFVNQYAGAAPTAPTLSEPTTIDKIAAVLGGIAYGPGYAQSLREERQRPIQQFQAAQERYQGRRAQGLELAERQREQKTRRAQELSNRDFEAEFQRETRRLNLTDDRERALLADALLSRRQREDDERQAAEQRRKEKAQQERDARLIARDYGKLTDDPKIALELGRYYAGLTDKLSPGAAKFESVQNRLAEAKALRLARLAAGGGSGGGAGPLMAQLENGDMVPASEVNKATGRVILNGKPLKVTGYVGGKIPAKKQAAAPQGQQKDSLGIR